MPVYIHAKVSKSPSPTTSGLIGIRITGDSPVVKPTRLAVAIDTSGSMEGERIDSVKRCLKVVINRLRVDDVLSVVGFSSTSTNILSEFVISEANRATALQSIDSLVADGGTNAEVAIAALGAIYRNEKPDAMLFLTDGHINEGISSRAGLYSLLSSHMGSVPFFTLGYGESHNADLLRYLALKTNATYTFAEDETALPASMGELLTSLQYEVAKNVSFTVPTGWTCLEPNYDRTDSKYEFGSIVADKPTWALFSLAPGTQLASYPVCSVKLQRQELSMPVILDDSINNLDVVEQEYRCLVGKTMESFATLFERSDVENASTELKGVLETLRSDPDAAIRPLVIRMIAQLEELLEECNRTLRTPTRVRRRDVSPPSLAYRSRGMGANYATQRGTSTNRGVTEYLFSSPAVRHNTVQIVNDYSQSIIDDPVNTPSIR